MTEYKPIEFELVKLSDNCYTNEKSNQWLSSSLVQKVKEEKLVPFKLPLQCINTGLDMWNGHTVYDIARHVKRALAVDTSYPVILDERGEIIDGWHRILRALIDDKTYVMAVRFKKTPPPDIYKE